MPRRLLTIIAALMLAVAACGDDDDTATEEPVDDTVTQDDEAVTDEPTTDDEAATAEEAAVTVVDFAFDPSSIEVPVGTTVVWTNEDSVAHTVTAGEPGDVGDAFDKPLDPDGGTVEITFDEPGTQPYFCAIHPTMTGEVVVS